MNIELPIIVLDDLDGTLYLRKEDAELHLEPWYADNEVAELYDAKGRKLKMVTDGSNVRIEQAEDEPTHGEYLRKRLHEVLVANGRRPIE